MTNEPIEKKKFPTREGKGVVQYQAHPIVDTGDK